MGKAFTISFSSRLSAQAIRIRRKSELSDSLRELGLVPSRSVIVLVGGAGGLMDRELDRLRPLFTESIAPLAEETGAVVIDGGTDSGIMSLMGRARSISPYHFPLIGIAVEKLVTWPNFTNSSFDPPTNGQTALESHHTHFILVPGSDWGEESVWISQIANMLAGSLQSVTVLINGGDIAYQDVAHSARHRRQVIVVAGSGRTADIFTDTMSGITAESRASKLLATGLFTFVHLENGPSALTTAIKDIFMQKE